MSPSVKSKSKSQEKASARASKEQHKTSPKTSKCPIHGSGTPPILGTFQTPETSPVATSTRVQDSIHLPKPDDADERSSSPQGTVSECDSASNNGSCSGESEESKEKVTIANSSIRPDSIPGCDNDRREKIRLKNERKHQRQRERRAQELHDRCCGYLMSRKLESLAQQLVAMGFSSERATLALMLNDGKLEQSVSWLFEGSEEQTKDTTCLVSEGTMKIDISDELAQISSLEVKYNCSKQEVERAVVASEGDLKKAENTIETQKQESLPNQSKSEDSAQNNSQARSQGLPAASVSMQQRGNESDFNHYKVGGGGSDSIFPDLDSGNVHSPQPNHPNATTTEKRWSGVTGSSPSAMLAMAPSMQQAVSPFVKMEGGRPIALTNEGRMIQQGVGREPVMMQHPQFTNAKQNSMISLNSFPSGTGGGWYVNSIPGADNVRSNGKLLQTQSIRSVSPNHLEQFCQAPYKEYSHFLGPVDYSSTGVGGFCKAMAASSSSSPPPTMPPRHQGSWSTSTPSSSLAVPTSLGLFSGHQNAAARTTLSSHSHMDWNTGGYMPEFDYTSIDWSLNAPSSSVSGGLWLGISSLLRNSYGDRRGGSQCMSGLQSVGMARETSSSAGLREWTTPFAGKDIFSVPRQFVTSPPM